MSRVSSPFQVRLQDLKLWQGNFDSLLQNKTKNTTTASDYESIDGISALDTTNSVFSSPEKSNVLDPDKRQISPSKPFEQLLEEKLAEDKPNDLPPKPKRPFLKKGEGLARFHYTPIAPSQRKGKNRENVKISNEKPKGILKNLYKTEVDFTPLKMPDFIIKPRGTWQAATSECEEEIKKVPENLETIKSIEVSVENVKQNLGVQNNRFNASVIQRISDFAASRFGPPGCPQFKNVPDSPSTRHKGEQTLYEEHLEKELQLFETLEQKVQNSSFCSTNTSVLNLLSSTPNKIFQHKQRSRATEKQLDTSQDSKSSCNEEGDLQIADEQLSLSIRNERVLHLHEKLEDVTKKTDILQNLLINLEKMNKEAHQGINVRVHTSASTRHRGQIDASSFSSEDHWSTDSRSVSPESEYTEGETTCRYDTLTRINVATNTSFESLLGSNDFKQNCTNCDTLRSELEVCKKELLKCENEKAKLNNHVKDMEKRESKLNRNVEKLKKEHAQNIKELRDELENERKKFSKERMVFESYVKDSQNKPNRKEREEISNLKQELAETKELLKLKETKNGATQARLRNNIKQLEKNLTESKTEIEKLQKENAKLNANQRISRKPNDSKILHEINKNLTKLAEETLKKQLNKSGDLKYEETSKIITKNQSKEQKEDIDPKNHNSSLVKVYSELNKSPGIRNNSTGSEIQETSGSGHLSVEKQYECIFGQFNSPRNLVNSVNEKQQIQFPDGSSEIKYSNGNVKTISPDGQLIRINYFNGDIKETDLTAKTIKYFYFETGAWHTQFEDGTELIEYADEQKSKRNPDGKIEISYADGSFRVINPDGTEEQNFPDGSKTIKTNNGETVILLPNGQKEIHTKEHKRREYPDGTVRTLHKDGTVETRYPNGRIRVKDPQGNLLMDTQQEEQS